MSRDEHSLRLFVAAYPPASTVDQSLQRLRTLDLPPHRLTPPEQVHITLQFIGEVSQRELNSITEAVEAATNGVRAFSLQPLKLISLPHRGPARLIALETDAPAPLIDLHRRLAQRLARSARLNPADRFLPHLTLCRFHSPSRMPAVDIDARLEPFPVHRAQLMRSKLMSGGAQHSVLASFDLIQL